MNNKNVENKIAIIIPSLGGGGAEKMRIYLAKNFIECGYEVDFVLFKKTGELLSLVPKEVNIIDLKAINLRGGFFPLLKYFKRNKPDAILSALWPVTVISIWAKIFSRIKARIIVSEHNTFSRTPVYQRPFNKFIIPLSMMLSYAKADFVIGVSNGVVTDLKRLSRSKRARFKTIYNPACPEISLIESMKPDNSFWTRTSSKKIIAIGKLKVQKDYPTLLKAFRILNNKIDVELLILGEGEERKRIEELIKEFSIESRVHLPGFVENPFTYLKSSDLFVLSSIFEGLGNVIIEALATGTPVVSTDCQSGPAEILENGKYGTLVPVGNPNALANAIIDNLQKQHDPALLIERAKFFSHEKIAKEYLKLLFPKDIQFAG